MPLIAQPAPPPGGELLAKLHEINAEHGYIPENALRDAAEDLGVHLSRLYSAASFYAGFRFKPRGRHSIQVCLGTACYIRGGDKLLEKLETTLGITPGETTQDRRFTLETVHCVGSCSMSPVMRIEGETHGRLKAGRLSRILSAFGKDSSDPAEQEE